MDEWVKVGSAPNETLALMMEALLTETHIPVLIQRGAGFDVANGFDSAWAPRASCL